VNTRQLGRVGLVFLGVYLVVSSLATFPASMRVFWVLGFPPAGEIAESLMWSLGVFALTVLLPGAFIISRREWLADVLFAGDWDSHLSIEPKALLAVGLVLIVISTLIPGLIRAPLVVMQVFGGGGLEATVGPSVEVGVRIALGVVLIGASKPLAAKLG